MIDHNKKFIFIHIPKCGGKTIEKVFWDVDPKVGSSDHTTYRRRQKMLPYTNCDISDYKVFSIVRNPWDRYVSYYSYLKRIKKMEFNTFESFVKKHGHRKMYKNQMYFLKDSNNEIKVDYIGRFENFEKTFDDICELTEVSGKLLHLNKTYHPHYSSFYTDETIKITRKRFRKEINYFGYDFEDLR
jgi:hypothetical protein